MIRAAIFPILNQKLFSFVLHSNLEAVLYHHFRLKRFAGRAPSLCLYRDSNGLQTKNRMCVLLAAHELMWAMVAHHVSFKWASRMRSDRAYPISLRRAIKRRRALEFSEFFRCLSLSVLIWVRLKRREQGRGRDRAEGAARIWQWRIAVGRQLSNHILLNAFIMCFVRSFMIRYLALRSGGCTPNAPESFKGRPFSPSIIHSSHFTPAPAGVLRFRKQLEGFEGVNVHTAVWLIGGIRWFRPGYWWNDIHAFLFGIPNFALVSRLLSKETQWIGGTEPFANIGSLPVKVAESIGSFS